MSKRVQPSGNVTRTLPPPARRSRRAMSCAGRGVVGEEVRARARRCPRRPSARSQSAKRRGLATTPAPRGCAARWPGVRAARDDDLHRASLPRARARPGRGRRATVDAANATSAERRAAPTRAGASGDRAPPAPPAAPLARLAPPLAASAASARRSSPRLARRASSHDCRMAHAAASSMRARAFLPRTSLACSDRCACTVVSRSSQSSTSRPVASAICCASARASRAAIPSPPLMSSGSPTTKRTTLSSSASAFRAARSALRSRPSSAPRGCAMQPQVVVDGDADARLARVERDRSVPSRPRPARLPRRRPGRQPCDRALDPAVRWRS